MNSNYQKGKLKRWNDNKGFGFVSSSSGENDVFIHVSALKRMARRPTVGDIIIYQLHTDNDGRKRAVNAKIEGVPEVESRPVRKNIKKQDKSNWFPKVISIALVVLIGSIVYNKFVMQNKPHEKSTVSAPSFTAEGKSKKNYSCAGKIYCSEMTSCDEAKFYQRNCPGTKMDGDGDGIPCESQWCRW
ncbi:MAG: excalibur calcium-binding domain-containing protein [Sedimenticola sp.]|nr:excalibur calcium-binding domain-containing protein [Sedimenticola sp.]